MVPICAERAQQPPLPPIEYEVYSSSSGSPVCIACTFNDNAVENCIAVVHQRISQLNSSGLMNIESNHKFTRSGDTAYGCIEKVNLEQFSAVPDRSGGRQWNTTAPNKASKTYVSVIVKLIMAKVAML